MTSRVEALRLRGRDLPLQSSSISRLYLRHQFFTEQPHEQNLRR